MGITTTTSMMSKREMEVTTSAIFHPFGGERRGPEVEEEK
jgi:hypothetical protein